MSKARSAVLRSYFQALTAGDINRILSLFSDRGRVTSPFLGDMDARDFFAKLQAASAGSQLTVLDILHGDGLSGDGSSGDGTATAAGRFRYQWTLKDGDVVTFEGVDHFVFDAQDRITRMTIYYDTHPLRQDVGDKYA